MKLTSEREEEIVELAEAVAERFCSNSKVDPTLIAAENGISVVHDNFDDAFDGMLEYCENEFFLYSNLDRVEALGSGRDRFTIAHELGHYYIDEHRRALQSGKVKSHRSFSEQFEAGSLVEFEADLFAASLLMPPSRFERQRRRSPEGIAGVLRLQEVFGTSVTSTCVQYVKRCAYPCAVIRWSPTAFEWRIVSPPAWKLGFRWTLRDMEKVPQDSATGKALVGATEKERPFSRGVSTTAFWFQNVTAGSRRDLVLCEESIQLGRYGALTLLYPHPSSENGFAELLQAATVGIA
jgi:Zn-dependent peptidase ImmA (M78 family)